MIELRGVSKSFAATGEVVAKFDLQIPAGQFVSLLGPSGCGKSTLLRLIAGLETADTGSIYHDASRLSFVFQEAQLLPWRNALENVCLPLELAAQPLPIAEQRERAAAMLARVGLADAAEKHSGQLSGGMKMRVSLARALVTEPEILLLDEPLSALDDEARFALQEDLRAYWRSSGMTVIFVTHSINEAVFLAERQVVLSRQPARIQIDRKSLLPAERTSELRLSPQFLEDVREIQSHGRSSGRRA